MDTSNDDAAAGSDHPVMDTDGASSEESREEGEEDEDEAVPAAEVMETPGGTGAEASMDSVAVNEAAESPGEKGDPGDGDSEEEGQITDGEEGMESSTVDPAAAEADTAIGPTAETTHSGRDHLLNEEVADPTDAAVETEVEPPVDPASGFGASKGETEEAAIEENLADEDDTAEKDGGDDEDSVMEEEAGVGTNPAKVEEMSSAEFDEEAVAMEVESSEEPNAEDVSHEAFTSAEKKEPVAENGSSTADESSFKELPYSTRGRSTGSTSGEDKLERAAVKEALEDLSRLKETPAGVSFLDALSDEERRTRTRFVPEVDGMHTLRKHEVKEDMALARSLPSIASSNGSVQGRAARLAASTGRKKDAMNVDGEESDLTVYDVRTTTIQLSSSEITIPSDSFVAPEGVIIGETEGTVVLKETTKKDAALQSPSVVETVTAFNPPRPPESVGAKKKHRALRWERRPEDIEVDMKNYRRTVQRTRQELKKSEAEYERLETVDAHLRRHFLNHLELLNEEYKRLHDAMQIEVQKLMKEADLGVSRTRSKNLTRVSVVMRDVLTILSKNEGNGTTNDGDINVVVAPTLADCLPGIGGLNAQAFVDWDRSTDIRPLKPAISWIQVGQKVATPYGDGTVKAVIAPENPQASTLVEKEKNTDSDSQKNGANEEARGDFQRMSNREKVGTEQDFKDPTKSASLEEKSKYSSLQPAQVEVNLELGVATFGIDAIKSVESQAHLNDAELGKRWRGMMESALEVGPNIDVQGMSSLPENGAEMGDDVNKDASLMDIDGETKGIRTGLDASKSENEIAEETFLPVGSSLFPTKGGRGNYLYNMDISDIEKELHEALYDGHGVLGRVSQQRVRSSRSFSFAASHVL